MELPPCFISSEKKIYLLTERQVLGSEVVRHEREISNAGRLKLDFAERYKCTPVLLRLSLAGNQEKPILPLYGNEWRERGWV
jgi:hypothetical protein